MVDRLMLPSLSANEARARSSIAREVVGRRVPALSGVDGAALLSLEPLARGGLQAIFDKPHWLEVEWAGARLLVELPSGGVDSWLRGFLGGVTPATLSTTWREAAITRAFGMILKALSATGQGKARLVSQSAVSPPAIPSHSFSLTLRYPASGETVHGRLHVDGLGLLLVTEIVVRLPCRHAATDQSRLPIPMRLAIGETGMTLSLLREVRRGDVVLITRRFVQADDQLLLQVPTPDGQWGLPVQIGDMCMTVIDSMRRLTSDQSQPSSSEFQWDDLPIHLSFDLGEKILALRELQRLQSGETLPLDRPLDRCVSIRANGVVIGSGELVDIDGRLGVSVASLNATGAATTEESREMFDDEVSDSEVDQKRADEV